MDERFILQPVPAPGLLFISSADEMHNLDAVAFVEGGCLPVSPSDDLAIEFDGEAFGREFEMFDEFFQS